MSAHQCLAVEQEIATVVSKTVILSKHDEQVHLTLSSDQSLSATAAALGHVAAMEFVASTNSPHMQASPPITKSCCLLLPWKKCKCYIRIVCIEHVCSMPRYTSHLHKTQSFPASLCCRPAFVPYPSHGVQKRKGITTPLGDSMSLR